MLVYADSSVLLARLLAEDRAPPDSFFDQPLVASRLAEYEIWNRLHSRHLEESHGEAARALLARLAFAEMVPAVLARALEPFPLPVRTLDALHLASAHFLRENDPALVLVTYDERMTRAARALGLAVSVPESL